MVISKDIKQDIKQGEFICPTCNGTNFILIGLQRQKGLFKDRELWTCKSCRSTFARESIDKSKAAENESFNKRASHYYCKIKFAK